MFIAAFCLVNIHHEGVNWPSHRCVLCCYNKNLKRLCVYGNKCVYLHNLTLTTHTTRFNIPNTYLDFYQDFCWTLTYFKTPCGYTAYIYIHYAMLSAVIALAQEKKTCYFLVSQILFMAILLRTGSSKLLNKQVCYTTAATAT